MPRRNGGRDPKRGTRRHVSRPLDVPSVERLPAKGLVKIPSAGLSDTAGLVGRRIPAAARRFPVGRLKILSPRMPKVVAQSPTAVFGHGRAPFGSALSILILPHPDARNKAGPWAPRHPPQKGGACSGMGREGARGTRQRAARAFDVLFFRDARFAKARDGTKREPSREGSRLGVSYWAAKSRLSKETASMRGPLASLSQ